MTSPRKSFPVRNTDLLKNVASSSKISADIYDPFFGIKISSPRFGLETFNTYCNSMTKVKLSAISSLQSTSNTVFMAVILQSQGVKKSSNGKDYLTWSLGTLKDDSEIKLMIFGDGVHVHSKLEPGHVVAITNSQLFNNQSTTPTVIAPKHLTMKVTKLVQVLSLGQCPDYGICVGTKKNGDKCTNYINISMSPLCTYHIQTEAKKFRSIRGAFSAVSNERPKSMMARSPAKKMRKICKDKKLVTVKSVPSSIPSKSNVNLFSGTSVSPAIAAKARLGNKLMTKFQQDQQKENQAKEKTVDLGESRKRKASNAQEFFESQAEFFKKTKQS